VNVNIAGKTRDCVCLIIIIKNENIVQLSRDIKQRRKIFSLNVKIPKNRVRQEKERKILIMIKMLKSATFDCCVIFVILFGLVPQAICDDNMGK
jgi:hypothetical protein